MATETLTKESSAGRRMDVIQETGRRTDVSEIREEAATLRKDILRPTTTRWMLERTYPLPDGEVGASSEGDG